MLGHRAPVALVLVVALAAGCLGAEPARLEAPEQDEPYAPGWPPLEEAVVRPGAKIAPGIFSGDCTANFVFSSPDNRTLYVGTASHCVSGVELGGPVAIASGAVTGVLVYCSWGALNGGLCASRSETRESVSNDFALVQLPDGARHLVHPALVHWGGPTHLATELPANGAHVLTYGNTPLRDGDQHGPGTDLADPREGFVEATTAWTVTARFVPLSVSGDSGSAVMLANGTAVGVVVAINVTTAPANDVTYLPRALQHLHETTDLRVELKTFRMLAEPLLAGPGANGDAAARAPPRSHPHA